MKNINLNKARKEKNDEFYTQIEDIENELKHYVEYFKDKIVYCNCDSYDSNFYILFYNNFEKFGLKKLIVSGYKDQKRELFMKEIPDESYYLEYVGFNKIVKKNFNGDGDFRSAESIKLLKEANIVVTNPPFSLFREYVSQLVKYEKKFLIIGNINAITNKKIFHLIKENKVWLGYGFNSGAAHFINTQYKDYATAEDHKEGKIRVSGIHWFTNLDTKKRHKDLILYKTYNKAEYPTYDNYDAINVDKVKDIPKDYFKVIGVPITFLDKFNPEQFEIIDKFSSPVINNKHLYNRILIKRKNKNK